MRARSLILNLLTLLTLAATGCIVAAVALLLLVPGAVPVFLRQPTEPVQVSALTAPPRPTPPTVYPTLPPEWTATPSPQPSPTDTAVSIPSSAPSPTPGASDTRTATAPAVSATPAATSAAQNTTAPNQIKILVLANIRTGPGTNYPIVTGVKAGQTETVIGRDSSAQWFAISVDSAPRGTGWVSVSVASYGGNINDLPVIQAPPPPPPPTAAAPTKTPGPTPTPTATNQPGVGGANGIQTIQFQMRKTTGAINENMWFDFKVINNTANPITYGILAAHTDQGVTADSWHDPLLPGKELDWNDHINFSSVGTYKVYLGICYAGHDACRSGGAPWTKLSDSTTVTIR